MYLYIKALHIIFVVCWFAGLFYFPRLLIYNREVQDKDSPEKEILTKQYLTMQKRLWLGITWPSAILTLILGPTVMFMGSWDAMLIHTSEANWLWIKLFFVVVLYGYHLSLHYIYKLQQAGDYRYSGQQLRIWNEIATILLFAIVFLATVKSSLSFVWGILGIVALFIVLMSAIRIYARIRKK